MAPELVFPVLFSLILVALVYFCIDECADCYNYYFRDGGERPHQTLERVGWILTIGVTCSLSALLGMTLAGIVRQAGWIVSSSSPSSEDLLVTLPAALLAYALVWRRIKIKK